MYIYIKLKYLLSVFKNYLYYLIVHQIIFIRYRKSICLLSKKLKKESKLLAVLHTESIGGLITQINFYYKISKIYNLDFKQSFYYLSNGKNCNDYLIKKLKTNIEINIDKELYDVLMNKGLMKYLLLKGLVIPFDNDFINLLPEINYPLNFTKWEMNKGKKILNKLGLSELQNIVAVSWKSNDYWHNFGLDKPWDAYRESSPEKLLKGLKYLSSKGFNVVIVGDHNNINFDAQFFNLDALNKSDREFIDIFIFKIAQFSIIGQMGLKFIPELFGKNVLHHNAMLPQFQSRGIFLPKKYKYLKSKSIISLSNLLKLKLLQFFNDEGIFKFRKIEPLLFRNIEYFYLNGISLEENSEDEILNAIKEMLIYIKTGELKLSKKDECLQRKFRSVFFNNKKLFTNSKFNYGTFFGGYVSPSFLRKNKKFLDIQ